MDRIKKNWPTLQHRFIAFMMLRLLLDLDEPMTQSDFKLIMKDKGTISQTLKQLVMRGHVQKVCKTPPYTYRLTPGGENYGRYLISQFTRFNLDIFIYYRFWGSVSYPFTRLYQQSELMLEAAWNDGLFSCNPRLYVDLKLELYKLSWRIEYIKNDLFVSWLSISQETKQRLYGGTCIQLDELSELMDREFMIKYVSQSTRERYLKSGQSRFDFQIDINSFNGTRTYYQITTEYSEIRYRAYKS
jgi:hypothetical protein